MNINNAEIRNYLEGKTDNSRSEEIREWLINPENEQQVRQLLGEIWTNSQIKLSGDKPDFDEVLKRVHYRLDTQSEKTVTPHIQLKSKQNLVYQLFSKAAAILIIPLIVFSAYLYFRPVTEPVLNEISMREISTKPGTRTKIELVDGTMVWLNDGTTLKYPEQFSGDERKVFVDGEAYFEVKSNPQFPFVVENPMMTTVVTGTHFNLNAYSADNFFEATLLEGKIHLDGKSGKIELNPGQQVQLNLETNIWDKRDVKPNNSAAWINGKLIIQNERIGMAVKKLSRWYNVEIVVNDPELNSLELTCTLENEKIDQCMRLISQALPLRYNIEEVTVQGQIHQKVQLMRK